MKEVKVLAKDGQELMATTIEKTNKLILKGEAEIVETSPMTIKMLKGTKRYKQPTLLSSYDFEMSDDENKIPLGKIDNDGKVEDIYWYNGFHDRPFLSGPTILICGNDDSGKDTLVKNVLTDISYVDNYQVLYCNELAYLVKQFVGISNLKGTATNEIFIAKTADMVKEIMMDRFKLLENYQTNRIENISGEKLIHYRFFNKQVYSWDTIFTVVSDKNVFENERFYYQLKEDTVVYPVTAKEMYENLQSGKMLYYTLLNPIKGLPRHICKTDIEQMEDKYNPTKIVLVLDDLDLIMKSDNYKAVDTLKQAIGSIARLGRAVEVYMVIGCNRPSAGVIGTDLMNNIALKIHMGKIDSAVSTILFDKDISDKIEDIKGRGALGEYNRVYEFQCFNELKPKYDENIFQVSKKDDAEYCKDFDLSEEPEFKNTLIEESMKASQIEYAVEVETVEDIKRELNSNIQEAIKALNKLSDNINTVLDNIE